MAAYGISGGQYHRTRYGQRKRQEWRWIISDGSRLVRIRSTGGSHNRTVGDDPEYQADQAVDGRRRGMIPTFRSGNNILLHIFFTMRIRFSFITDIIRLFLLFFRRHERYDNMRMGIGMDWNGIGIMTWRRVICLQDIFFLFFI